MCIPVALLKVGQLPGFVIYTTTIGLCLLKIFEVFVFSTCPPCSSIAGGGILASTLDHGLASACGVWGNVQGLVSACGVMVIFCSTNDDEKLRALELALWLVGMAVGFLLGLVMHLQFGCVKGFEQALCL